MYNYAYGWRGYDEISIQSEMEQPFDWVEIQGVNR